MHRAGGRTGHRSGARADGRARRVAAVVGAAAVLLGACSSSAGRPPAAPSAQLGQQLDAVPSAAVSNAVLVDSTGRRLSLRSLLGKVVVVSDMMTLCQETCPLDTAAVVAAARAVQRAGLGADVVFLSVTIDPQRDTVARLAAYRRLYGPAPANWAVATGDAATLAAFWRRLGVYIERVPDAAPAPRDWLTGAPLTYDLTHSDQVLFLDRSGHERFVLDGAPHVAGDAPVPARLRAFLNAEGRGNVTHPEAHSWTLAQELQVVSWLAGKRVAVGNGAG